MKTVCFIIALFCSVHLHAQKDRLYLKNNISVEFFGTSYWIFISELEPAFYNVGYQRSIISFSKERIILAGRIGWGTYPLSNFSKNDYRLHYFPVELALMAGNGKHRFDSGISETEVFGKQIFPTGDRPNEWVIINHYRYLNLRIGYCYYPDKKGLMLRAGWTPFFIPPKQIVPYGFRGYQKYLAGGVTVGYAF